MSILIMARLRDITIKIKLLTYENNSIKVLLSPDEPGDENQKKMKIRYNHTSPETADSYDEALNLVQEQALAIEGGKWNPVSARENLVIIDCDEADYIYLSQEEADNDETGASAFATIEKK